MATSNIRIKKVCEWYGSEFEAQKCTTRYCCKRCAEHAYKDRQRKNRKKTTEAKVIATIIRQKEEAVSCKDFLSVQETANPMGVKRNAIYQLIYRGKLKAYRITSRVTRINRKYIEDVLNTNPYVRKSKVQSTVADENGEGITEFYTTKEIIKKFGGEQFVGVRPRRTTSLKSIIEAKRFGARCIATEYSLLSRNRRRRMIGFRIRRSEPNTISRMTSSTTM